ncbi:hypothetical protein BO94DRAFT_305569 [Aspergillus sclerotioniger CBS 115572]|uniref:Uncharacterized protein n=1 Tax=Aspergillus sclerotioniger CBS 115572 TaxID=1450535 RepID=A0A317V1P9_9EURO|nr:hypothetical protein BO94DRAFT_305569 [Aspergillus sclerotioniger CBS 115572]PWY67995.1 hypothetical protein BO94DRAFT_305569 [Aspergillus sclerotioniger CBS 115572]
MRIMLWLGLLASQRQISRHPAICHRPWSHFNLDWLPSRMTHYSNNNHVDSGIRKGDGHAERRCDHERGVDETADGRSPLVDAVADPGPNNTLMHHYTASHRALKYTCSCSCIAHMISSER